MEQAHYTFKQQMMKGMSEMETIMEVIQTINIEELTQEQFRDVVKEIFQAFAEREEEHKLAVWLQEQKLAYKDGLLSDDQIKKLESLPNFSWKSE